MAKEEEHDREVNHPMAWLLVAMFIVTWRFSQPTWANDWLWWGLGSALATCAVVVIICITVLELVSRVGVLEGAARIKPKNYVVTA